MWIPFGRPAAMARIAGGVQATDLYGSVKFYQMGDAVLVTVDITGLPKTDTDIFAMHIHNGQNCTGQEFSDALGHFNPENLPHPNHAGDLPPLFSCGGRAYMEVLLCRFQIQDIIGRAVIIHDGPDDFTSQPAGNSGSRIACGIITTI